MSQVRLTDEMLYLNITFILTELKTTIYKNLIVDTHLTGKKE